MIRKPHGIILTLIALSTAHAFAIINGTKVEATDPIAQVAVALFDTDGSMSCNATRIAQDTYISAAHCLTKTFGRYIRINGQRYDVSETRHDPQYNPNTDSAAHDVVIFKTQPAPGPQKVARLDSSSTNQLTKNGPLFIAGVGLHEMHGEAGKILNKATFKIVGIPYRKTLDVRGVVQANHRLSGACEADSGGPGYRLISNEVYIWGVLANGDNHYLGQKNNCDGVTYMTQVAADLPWIEKKMAELNPPLKSKATAQIEDPLFANTISAQTGQ